MVFKVGSTPTLPTNFFKLLNTKIMVFSNDIKMQLAQMCGKNDLFGLIDRLESLLPKFDVNIKNGNGKAIQKFIAFLYDYIENPMQAKLPYKMLKKGNMKLPFYSFSTLPIVTCMGSGDCENWCYSFKAWRYPSAFFRQCQNTLLMSNFERIQYEVKKLDSKIGALKELPKKNKRWIDYNLKTEFRLYVDGDFNTTTDLVNWMELLKDCKHLNAYGYSKSFPLFLELNDQGYKFPSNYTLNLSNGGKYDFLTEKMKELSITRGLFYAVKVPKGKKLRDMFEHKVFQCPIKCGTCTRVGHACGSKEYFQNKDIVIAMH